jgi:mono/diheme cytochrome c family protein
MSTMTFPRLFATFTLIATLAIAVSFSIGCGTARRDALVAKPLHRPTSQVELGDRIFSARCNQCHPGGAAGLGPAINNKPVPGFMIAFQVRHGLGAMPRFSKSQLSDRQLDAVVAYLKDLRHRPVTLAKSS